MFKSFLKFCWKNLIVRTLLLILLITVILVIALMAWMRFYTQHEEIIVVPDLRQLHVDDVETILMANSLNYEVIDSVYQSTADAGTVIEQIPRPNATVKPNRTVFVTIKAHGEQQIVVPDVKELSYRHAQGMLKAVGFVVDSIRYQSYPYKDLTIGVESKGRMVLSGEKLPYGSRLVLLVGNGINEPEEVIIDSDVMESVEKEWFE